MSSLAAGGSLTCQPCACPRFLGILKPDQFESVVKFAHWAQFVGPRSKVALARQVRVLSAP